MTLSLPWADKLEKFVKPGGISVEQREEVMKAFISGQIGGPQIAAMLHQEDQVVSRVKDFYDTRHGTGAGSAAAGAGGQIAGQAVVSNESVALASKFMCFIEVKDKASGRTYRTAAVVCSSRHIATYQHEDHSHFKIGDQVQVVLPATGKVMPTQVALVQDKNLDIIILELQGKERLPAPELRPAERGEGYVLLGQSSKDPGSTGTCAHGHIANARANAFGHILGDTYCGKGDSGGGVFALDGACLLGMCVGRNDKHQQAVIVPADALQDCLLSLELSDTELSDMDLAPHPTYSTD